MNYYRKLFSFLLIPFFFCANSAKANSSDELPDPYPKKLALTFDDSPNKTLQGIISAFTDFNKLHPDCPASATLFCSGHRITKKSVQSLQIAYAAGFEMGNHGFSHRELTYLSYPEIEKEIFRVDKLLQPIDGKQTHLFRAPYGSVNDDVKKAVLSPIIDWSVDTKDWTGVSVGEIVDCVLKGARDGAIILMHDGFENTVLAVKKLLPLLKEQGYQVVTVSYLAEYNGCNLQVGGVYTRARKQNR